MLRVGCSARAVGLVERIITEVLMTTRALLVPVAAALALAACREPASPASSSSSSPRPAFAVGAGRSEEHTSELQSHSDLVCRLLLEKKKHRTVAQLHP